MRQSTYLRRALKALMVRENWTIRGVMSGDQEKPTTTIKGVMAEVNAVDAAHVLLSRNIDTERAWIFVVWQGPDATYQEGEEIICDYTLNLSPVLDGF